MEKMGRRTFVRNISYGASAAALGARVVHGVEPTNQTGAMTKIGTRLHELRKPVAIAMWDFSWILRHHRFGSFEDWDAVLDGLLERGYNAIRMDAMPQFVAADTDGNVQEEFFCVKDGWKPSLWGNDVSMHIRPREALLEFLPKCYERGIHVGLSSWFLPHGAGRKAIFQEEGGLLRSWIETLEFLDQNGLLDQALYVDVLNEYPFWHGYVWLKSQLDARSDVKKFKEDNPEAHIPDVVPDESSGGMNPVQRDFYNNFAKSTLNSLKKHWSGLPFYVSLDSGMPLANIDLQAFDGLDYHVWFVHGAMGSTGYGNIHEMKDDKEFYKIYPDMMHYWKEHRNELIEWMEGRISVISTAAHKQGIPCGNTEGWGPISWIDHPALGWEWVKESAEICCDLAVKHGCKFICTSNFTHPHFKGMWDDVTWHRKITDRIKHG